MKSMRKKSRLSSAVIQLIAILVVSFVPSVQAATFCVSDATGLQGALTQAASNGEDDIIKVQQGTYVSNFVYASSEANAITIEGGYTSGCASRVIDSANTVLDGNEGGNVLVISTDQTIQAKVEGLTLQKGVASNILGGGLYFNTSKGDLEIVSCAFSGNSASGSGGALYAHGSAMTLTDNTFSGNSTSSNGGGAISAHGFSVTLINNIFSENHAKYRGGAVSAYGSNAVILINNTFSGNSAVSYFHDSDGGGGLYAEGDTVNLTNNTFSENSAYYGGGVRTYISWTLTLTDNTFRGNTASHGGGVYAHSSTVTLTDNTFSENSALFYGGGLRTYLSTTVTLRNNTFSENSGSHGGGVCVDGYTSILINNIFSGNSATSAGGGILVSLGWEEAIGRIYNNVFWMNGSAEGADLWIGNDYDGDFFTSPVEVFNNNFDQSAAGIYIQIPFAIDPSNLNKVDPLFVDGARGDYHLTASSQCINAGTNDAPDLPSTDKDGNPRICDGTVDMGAYEFPIFNVEPSGKCGGKTPCYSIIQDAIDAMFGTGAIRISEGTHLGTPKVNTAGKKVTLEGGWDTKFKRRSGTTILRNAPKAQKGSITLQNLNIKP